MPDLYLCAGHIDHVRIRRSAQPHRFVVGNVATPGVFATRAPVTGELVTTLAWASAGAAITAPTVVAITAASKDACRHRGD